jgi:hypothetical protein
LRHFQEVAIVNAFKSIGNTDKGTTKKLADLLSSHLDANESLLHALRKLVAFAQAGQLPPAAVIAAALAGCDRVEREIAEERSRIDRMRNR